MAKHAPDACLDAALDYAAAADVLHVCSDQPADYAGIAGVSLGSVALTPGAGNGDFTIGDGDSSGRKLTVAAQADIEVTDTGEADHVVLALTSDTTLRYVTTISPQALTQGNTATLGAWDIEIADPT